MELKGLIVLALDLQFGLQFFDQEFEPRNFGFQFLHVSSAGLRAMRRRHIEIVRWGMRLRSASWPYFQNDGLRFVV